MARPTSSPPSYSYFRSMRVLLIVALVIALSVSLGKIHSLLQEREMGPNAHLSDSETRSLMANVVAKGNPGMRGGAAVAAHAAAAVEASKTAVASVEKKKVKKSKSGGKSVAAVTTATTKTKAKPTVDDGKMGVALVSTRKKTGSRRAAGGGLGGKKKKKKTAGPTTTSNRLIGSPNKNAVALDPKKATKGGTAVPAYAGPVIAHNQIAAYKYTAGPRNNSFPLLKLASDEVTWLSHFIVTNRNLLLSAQPAGTSALDTLPYPPGMPSLLAYKLATSSPTFYEMEKFSDNFNVVNKLNVDLYLWSRDPVHSWSRKYEYVWTAEALRAMLPADHRKALEKTWPRASATAVIDYYVIDAASGFIFFPQFLASRLGVKVIALDMDAAYVPLFGGTASHVLGKPVPTIPFILAKIENMGLSAGSIDAVTVVSVIDTLEPPVLASAIKEFKRVLKRGGRLLVTFNTGQPRLGKDSQETKNILTALRAEMIEDTSHGAAAKMLARDGRSAQQIFHNRKATPLEFGEYMITITAHIFINP